MDQTTAVTTTWGNFDRWAGELAKKTIDFNRFARETRQDFRRLARIVMRRKRMPSWWTDEDVYEGLITAAWHNFFVRAGGFNPAKYRSAGAWIRWKAKNRVMKDMSKARGEDAHTRKGPGAPEYLSKTGELPEVAREAEAAIESAIEIGKLAQVCSETRDFVILRAMAQALGEKDATIVILLADPTAGFKTRREANKAISAFETKVRARAA